MQKCDKFFSLLVLLFKCFDPLYMLIANLNGEFMTWIFLMCSIFLSTFNFLYENNLHVYFKCILSKKIIQKCDNFSSCILLVKC